MSQETTERLHLYGTDANSGSYKNTTDAVEHTDCLAKSQICGFDLLIWSGMCKMVFTTSYYFYKQCCASSRNRYAELMQASAVRDGGGGVVPWAMS